MKLTWARLSVGVLLALGCSCAGNGNGEERCPPVPTQGACYLQIPVSFEGEQKTRQFWISIPAGWQPDVSTRLVVGLHGRDYSGRKMKSYLGLEAAPVEPRTDEIFVYPDALSRDWGPWGRYIGWQLGPGAKQSPAAGEEDLAFIDAMIQYMTDNYLIDSERIFATGQSWGGDFTNVLGCVRGNVFRAVVAVAANGIYYLTSPSVSCQGTAAVWSMHGKADPYFSVELGELYRDFWLAQHACDGTSERLDITTAAGAAEDCVEYNNCTATTRWCLYSEEFGHQIPWDYFAQATMYFFRSF